MCPSLPAKVEGVAVEGRVWLGWGLTEWVGGFEEKEREWVLPRLSTRKRNPNNQGKNPWLEADECKRQK